MKKTIAIILTSLILMTVLSGCFHQHTWEDANCLNPKTCLGCGETEGTAPGYTWEDATCDAPKRCRVCWEKQGEALGHSWGSATCTDPAICANCGLTDGVPTEHVWTEAGPDTPAMCQNCNEMVPLDLPANGQIFIGNKLSWGCTLTVKCSGDQSCYVKMKDADRNDVLSFFVRAGQKAEVFVPSGHYYVYFAHGVDWYGSTYLFGKDTTYSMDEELTDYVSYSWEYDLVPSYNGNFSDTPIDASQF